MGLFTNIQSALDQRLNSVSGLPIVAWENTDFDPTEGTAFVRPTVVSGESSVVNITDKLQINPGVYVIDIFAPSEKGTAALNGVIDDVYDHFKTVDVLTQAGTDVWIQGISRSVPIRDEIWFRGQVSVQFLVYST